MRGIFSGVLILAYVSIGAILHSRAMASRLDPGRPIWAHDLFRPTLFTPQGLARRRTALLFYVFGGLALILLLWALAA